MAVLAGASSSGMSPYGEGKNGSGDRVSPIPIKDRQAVDGGDQRLRESVGDCEPDRLDRERTIGC